MIGRLSGIPFFFLGRDDGHVSVARTLALFPKEEENDEIILSFFLYTTIRVERRRVMKEIYSWSTVFFLFCGLVIMMIFFSRFIFFPVPFLYIAVR